MRRPRSQTASADQASPAFIVTSLALALVIYGAHTYLFSNYVNDDAFISFRYAEFIALGRGPYFNLGEHVEGYSNPLLVWLLVPVIAWAGAGAAAAAAKAIGLAAGLLTFVARWMCAERLASAHGPRSLEGIAGVTAAGLVAVAPGFAVNAMNGLETTLFALALTTGAWLTVLGAQSGRWRGAGVAFAAAALTRPEGAAIVAVFWAALAVSSLVTRTWPHVRSLLLADAAIVFVVVTLQVIGRNYWYDGEWLPNTYFAKAGGFANINAVTSWNYIRDGVVVPVGGVFVAGLGVAGYAGRGGQRWLTLPVGVLAAAGALLPLASGTDWMIGERLVVPYLPLVAIVVVLGWARIAGGILRRSPRVAAAVLLGAVPALWLAQRDTRQEFESYVTTRARGYQEGHAALADWLCSGPARPGDAIALMDIGIIGYRCRDQRILDVTGLTDRHIGKSPGTFLDKQYDVGYVLDQNPRFIVITLVASGDPEQEPTHATFKPATRVDSRLLQHADFKRQYVRPASSAASSDPWLDRLAGHIGARRVFQHLHPGSYYLLAVFEKR